MHDDTVRLAMAEVITEHVTCYGRADEETLAMMLHRSGFTAKEINNHLDIVLERLMSSENQPNVELELTI